MSGLVKIVPDAGFPVSQSAAGITANGVQVTLNIIGENNLINTALEVNVQMLSVLFFSDSVDNSVAPYALVNASSAVQALSLTNALTFNAPLIGNDELLFDKYQIHKAFNVLLTMDASGNVIHYSNTLSV